MPPLPVSPRLIGVGVAAVLALFLVFGGYYTIDRDEVGVVTRWGEIIHPKQTSGLHFKLPFADSVYHQTFKIQEYTPEKAVNTYTIDNQEVDIEFTVFFSVEPDQAAFVYANVPDYKQRLGKLAGDRLKSQMGQINIQQLAEKRGEIREKIKDSIHNDSKHLGLNVTDIQLSDLKYDPGFRAAVAKAAVEKANIEAFIYKQTQQQKEAETVKITAIGAANAKRETARGEADANLLVAEAEAKAIEVKGAAQATAIKAQAEALKASPELVELRKAEKWNGALPSSVYAGAPIPFMTVPNAAATAAAGR